MLWCFRGPFDAGIIYREKNVGVVIRDERELNQIRMNGEKAICGGKENAAPKVAPNDNVRSKAQCLRCERERAGIFCRYQKGGTMANFAR